MTDYSVQGKTRDFNVVDISKCRTFQGAYTCLSRGTTFSGTLVMREFDNEKLTGELDGELRQEFWELNYLNAITMLRYEGCLPDGIQHNTRRATIPAFRQWNNLEEEKAWHPAIRKETPEDLPFIRQDGKLDSLGIRVTAINKRKAPPVKEAPPKKWCKTVVTRRNRPGVASPTGPAWDSIDHSCTFDA
jgi:hypothetical protein